MWQVSGRSGTEFGDYVRLDLYYVDNWSLLTDLLIVLRTIPAVLCGRGRLLTLHAPALSAAGRVYPRRRTRESGRPG